MKLVVAVIQPMKLSAVREALSKIEVTRMTIFDAQEYGYLANRAEIHPALRAHPALLRMAVLEIVVNDDFLKRTVDTIAHVAPIGAEEPFDSGVIFVLPADDAIVISDGSHGPGAV